MTVLSFASFTGEIPRLIPRLLPDGGAQVAIDCRLTDGGLTPVRKSRFEFGAADLPTSAPATIYRHGDDWLYWPALVNAAPGPVAQDRLYYTGDGEPKVIVGGDTIPLAIDAPTVALVATLTGTGTGDTDSRIYTYTNVTAYGEESPPAPASNVVEWQSGHDVELSGFDTAMGAGRVAVTQRIYRSQSSTSGGADFYMVAERPAGTGNFTDIGAATDFLPIILPSRDWGPAPAGLRGLTSMPNGMMAGFVGKEVFFCEPWYPHAWPDKYRRTVDYDIVALGAYGTTLVVMTTGMPYTLNGLDPASMAMEKLELNLPCINAAGVVDLGYGIAYPSNDGLVLASQGGARLATERAMSREAWRRMVPQTFVGGSYDGRYAASYNYYDDVIGEIVSGTMFFDVGGESPFLIRSSVRALAFFPDISSNQLYYLSNGAIYEYDADGQPAQVMTWRSKEVVLSKPSNFGAIFIDSSRLLSPYEIQAIKDDIAAVLARNAEIGQQDTVNGSLAENAIAEYALADDDFLAIPVLNETLCSVSVYSDGELTSSTTDTNQIERLPGGFLGRKIHIDVVANVRVDQVALATAGAELERI